MPPRLRISSSARASRCAVVTPGATSDWSRSWHSASTAPDAAIASISAGVLGIGPRGRPEEAVARLAGRRRRDVRDDLGIDLVRGALAVHLAQQLARAVVVDQGRGLLLVDRQ